MLCVATHLLKQLNNQLRKRKARKFQASAKVFTDENKYRVEVRNASVQNPQLLGLCINQPRQSLALSMADIGWGW